MTRRYLLDSGIASLFVMRNEAVCRRAEVAKQAGHEIGISVIVLSELLGGYECSETRDENLARLNRRLPLLKVWPLQQSAAPHYATLFGETRRIGRTTQASDLFTAAIALDLGRCTIVSMDHDFRRIPGLSVEDWSLPLS